MRMYTSPSIINVYCSGPSRRHQHFSPHTIINTNHSRLSIVGTSPPIIFSTHLPHHPPTSTQQTPLPH